MVDVVIPTYRRSELVVEAVESALLQNKISTTVFVIEDGPVDFETQKNLKKNFSSKVLYIATGKNAGPAYTRNFGANLGKSPFVAFLDSDDLWDRDKIWKQINLLEKNSSYQWAHTNEIWFRNNKQVKQKQCHRKQGGFFLERLFERCLISPSAVLFKREFFQKTNGFHPIFRVAEDYEYWLRLNYHYAIAYIDEPLTIKRAGNWQQLSSTREIDRYRVLALHRFYRLYHHDSQWLQYKNSFFEAAMKKIQILIHGAEKYGHLRKVKEYQNWKELFKALRTKAILSGAEGTFKNSLA